jgi:hypothetical protein
VPAHSQLWLFNNVPVTSRAELLLDKGNKEELNLKNLEIVHAQVPKQKCMPDVKVDEILCKRTVELFSALRRGPVYIE